ncbi:MULTISPECIES: hypothetical protein [unclassified Allomuricauda]|uniref:hypothetical protein n=1 Tax=unclassified Allomuricauda TaxID=2615049 RepID=UPI00273DD5FD|nr:MULTISPECIES: hypothetical protein [unclassified Allomuricauda]
MSLHTAIRQNSVDHLGNVRVVFRTDGNEAGLKGFTDYYPFGMPMPNRTLSGAEGYRYPFSYYIKTDLRWSAMFSRVNICQLFKFIVSMIREKKDPYLFLPTSP